MYFSFTLGEYSPASNPAWYCPLRPGGRGGGAGGEEFFTQLKKSVKHDKSVNNIFVDGPFLEICKIQLQRTRLYKLLESGNGPEISDENWCSVKSKYLENKKWQKGIVKSTRNAKKSKCRAIVMVYHTSKVWVFSLFCEF